MSWAVSPTQVATWRLCTRKFLWQYVVGIKPPTKESAAKGTACHQVLEAWLNGKELSDATLEVEGFTFATSEIEAIVRPAMQHFPAPGTCTTEEKFRFDWRGVTWTGRTDAYQEPYRCVGVVYDLKSTKAKKWIKTEVELSCDPQAIIYGRVKGTRRVKFVYALTSGTPRAVAVETDVVGPGPVEDLLVEDAKDILAAIANAYHPLAVEPGPPSACEAFGGCPFVGNCTDLKRGLLGRKRGTATAGSKLIQLGRKQDDMGAKEMAAKFKQSLQSGPTMEVAAAGSNILPGKVVITETPRDVPTGVQIQTESGYVEMTTKAPDVVVQVAINSPESVDAGPPPLPPPPKQPGAPKKRSKKAAQDVAPMDAGEVAGSHSAPASTPPTAAPPPPALDTSASAAGTGGPSAVLDSTAQLASVGPTVIPPFEHKLSIRTLYVNCGSDAHPETVDLAKVMAEAHEYTKEKHNVNHWYEIGFTEGKASMAMFALEILRQHPACAQGTLRVKCSSYLPETALVLGELQAAAAETVR